ncbi:MAG: methionine--tRNA ligase, partial [Planctomycetota bacterium]
MGRFYVTTAIFYPNAVPHLGTAYEMIGADTIARWRRLRGDDVFFLSGNDEHALKVAQAAEAQGLEPLAYCDDLAAAFEKAWASLEVTYDEYVRTTQKRHHDTVTWFFERIRTEDEKRVAAGEEAVLYKGSYEGLYCVGCEAYLREKDLVEGKCPHHPDREPQRLQEDNWFFRLTAYEERLKEWYRDHPDWLTPEPKRNEMIGLLGEGLMDLSVSRPEKATKWGIPFPGDDGHVIYVWFEALINYVTGARLAEDGGPRDDEAGRGPGFWPADVHVIGKDILRFHTIIWPAMLWAADLPLPKAVSTHGFVQVGGAKMSKSSGGTVSPIDIAEEYGPEVLRYFLLREVPWGGDGEFSIERLEERYQADLANTVGNLLHRTLTMIEKYCGGEVPESGAADGPIAEHRQGARERLADALSLFDGHQFSQALDRVVDVA